MWADVCLCDDQSGQRDFRRVRPLSCDTAEAPVLSTVVWILEPENYLLDERRSEWMDRWTNGGGSGNPKTVHAGPSPQAGGSSVLILGGAGSDISRGSG